LFFLRRLLSSRSFTEFLCTTSGFCMSSFRHSLFTSRTLCQQASGPPLLFPPPSTQLLSPVLQTVRVVSSSCLRSFPSRSSLDTRRSQSDRVWSQAKDQRLFDKVNRSLSQLRLHKVNHHFRRHCSAFTSDAVSMSFHAV
jgi:hypothetical protein